jgi:hypothetical protein
MKALNCTAKSPFDRIEAAQQYLALLSKSVADNRQRVEADMMEATNHNSQRFLEVLRLGVYNLEQLEKHLKAIPRTQPSSISLSTCPSLKPPPVGDQTCFSANADEASAAAIDRESQKHVQESSRGYVLR